jgi:hypothetical protein
MTTRLGKDVVVYVGDSSGVTRKTLKREIDGAAARARVFEDAERLTKALLEKVEDCDLIILGDFKEMETFDIVSAWEGHEAIHLERVIVLSEKPDLMVDSSETAESLLKKGVIGLVSKPARLRHIKTLIEEKAKNESIRDLAKSLVTLTNAQRRKRKSILKKRYKQRRRSLSNRVTKTNGFPDIDVDNQPRRKSFPKNLYRNIAEDKSDSIVSESLPVIVAKKDKNGDEKLVSDTTTTTTTMKDKSEKKGITSDETTTTTTSVEEAASSTTTTTTNIQETSSSSTTTTTNIQETSSSSSTTTTTTLNDSLPKLKIFASPEYKENETTTVSTTKATTTKPKPIQTPILYSNQTLGEILKFSNGDRWFGPVVMLKDGKTRVPHGRGTLRFSHENSELVREKFWTGTSLRNEKENWVWMGPTNERGTLPMAGSYGTMVYFYNSASWCGKVQRKFDAEGRVFDASKVSLVGTRGVLRFVHKNTSWKGPIDLVRGRPYNGDGIEEDNQIRSESSKMCYSNGDAWTGIVDPMTYYPMGNGTMVYAKNRGGGMFWVGKVVEPFENVDGIQILDPSLGTFLSTSFCASLSLSEHSPTYTHRFLQHIGTCYW